MAPHLKALSETDPSSLESLLAQGVVWQGTAATDTPLWKLPTTVQDSIPFGVPEIDASLPHCGLACGALHELSVNDRDGLVTRAFMLPALLARNALTSPSMHSTERDKWHSAGTASPQRFIVWIGRRCWPTPFSLSPESLLSCLFIEPPTEKLALWTIETALRSPAVKLVIADTPSVSLVTTRRFALSARAYGTAALLIKRYSEQPAPSAAMTSWVISTTPSSSDAPAWELSLRRIKGGATPITSWIVTVEDDYGSRAGISLRTLPRVVDTGYQAQAALQKFGT